MISLKFRVVYFIILLVSSFLEFQPVFAIYRFESELYDVIESIASSHNLSLNLPLPEVEKFDLIPKNSTLTCQPNPGLKTSEHSVHWFYEDIPISNSDPEFRHIKLKTKGKYLQFRPKYFRESFAYIKYSGLYTCAILHESAKKLEISAMYEITLASVIQHHDVISIHSAGCSEIESQKNSARIVDCGYVTSDYLTSLVNYDNETIKMADSNLQLEFTNSSQGRFTFAILGYSNAYFMLGNIDGEPRREPLDSGNESLTVGNGFLDSMTSLAKKLKFESARDYVIIFGGILILLTILPCVAVLICMRRKSSNKSFLKLESWKDTQVIDKRDLVNQSPIGEGAFGAVFKAELWNSSFKPNKVVAVKELHQGLTDSYDVLQEVRVLLKITKHPNVLELVGFCVDPETKRPFAIVTEFCEKGSLSSFMQKQKNGIYLSSLVKIIKQVIEGMSHLERNKFVHRDLAARNVLLTSEEVVKIGDFGLTKDIQYVDYYKMTTGGLMPYKWMAPECILERKFTSKGDVWSFGVLIWEMFTFASDPYSDISSQDYCTAILSGYRLERPGNCPENVYELVEACWTLDFEERPSFAYLKKLFAKLSLKDTLLKSEPLDFNSPDYLSYVNHGLVTTPAQTSIGFFNQSYCRSGSDQSNYRTSNAGVYPNHRFRADSMLSNSSSLQDYQPKGFYNLSPTKFFNASITEQSTLTENNSFSNPQNFEAEVELEQTKTSPLPSFFFPEREANDMIGQSNDQ